MTYLPQLHPEDTKLKATFETNHGNFTVALYEELAPKTVKNFIELADKGYYDGVIFHRIIEDFMIQGGDPSGTGMGGESIYGEAFEDEFVPELYNIRGALSMANAGPNTNGSQFFIVTSKHVPADMLQQMEGAGYPKEIIEYYAENGGTPWLDRRHTVFGQVIEGMDQVDAIEQVETAIQDKPLEDVVIQSIHIER